MQGHAEIAVFPILLFLAPPVLHIEIEGDRKAHRSQNDQSNYNVYHMPQKVYAKLHKNPYMRNIQKHFLTQTKKITSFFDAN